MPFFSVIIPAFNRAALLARTLGSVRRQTFTDYEVIVVDDGSTDDTLELLRDFSWVKALRQNNRGPGAARNVGVRQCTGQYLAFLDSDDIWFPWSLATCAAILRMSSPPVFLAGKPFRFRDEAELPTAPIGGMALESFPDYLASGTQWRWWGVSSFVIRRDAFQTIGGFTDKWINGEDADLAMRLGVAGGFVQVTAPHTFGYREHAVSAMKDGKRTLAGAWHQVQAERSGRYPGGIARARERWRILTRHLRPVSLDCLHHGARADAWRLYRATFRWHVVLGRWRYLAGFPLKALWS